jgi:hypothetical protein
MPLPNNRDKRFLFAVRATGTGSIIPAFANPAASDREFAMAKKSVLAIGIDPAVADFTTLPGLTPVLVRSYIDAQIEQVQALGYDVESCLIDLGATAEAVAAAALNSRHFDCVVIGAGLRQPAPQLLLFEKIINLVHVLAPNSKICFNSNPSDTAAAVQRWVSP